MGGEPARNGATSHEQAELDVLVHAVAGEVGAGHQGGVVVGDGRRSVDRFVVSQNSKVYLYLVTRTCSVRMRHRGGGARVRPARRERAPPEEWNVEEALRREVRCGQTPVEGGGVEVVVGGDHDGFGVADGFDGGEVDGVVTTEGVGFGEVAGSAE